MNNLEQFQVRELSNKELDEVTGGWLFLFGLAVGFLWALASK